MDRTEAITCGREAAHCLAPAEAFSLLGDETRVQVLEALWALPETPASFSTLYDAVDVDTSPQFNYHLDQLVGPFVRKTGAGYELRTAGEHVVRALVAGSFNAHPTLEPFPVGDPCTRCGSDLRASYADERLAIDCPDCGRGHGEFGFPPGGLLDREGDALLRAFDRRVRHRLGLARDGVCPECGGPTSVALQREADCCPGADVRARVACEQCRHSQCVPVGLSLLDREPVAAHLRECGIDVGTTPYWQFSWCLGDERITVLSSDPWRIAVTVGPADGPGLQATVDGDLEIEDTGRG